MVENEIYLLGCKQNSKKQPFFQKMCTENTPK